LSATKTSESFASLAREFRKEVFSFKTEHQVGHLASTLSVVDILTTICFSSKISFDFNVDQIIFGKGHGSPAMYPILAKLGFFHRSKLDSYCEPSGILRLHADQSIPGCHYVGGSLGNALGYAAGLGQVKTASRFFVILGDAELYEGSVWESLMYLSHNFITNVLPIVDRNGMGILGRTEELLKLEPLPEKFEAFGFSTVSVDGHNYQEIENALAPKSEVCTALICRTTKGKGVSYMEGVPEYHSKIPKSQSLLDQGKQDLL
jgi:transketolase